MRVFSSLAASRLPAPGRVSALGASGCWWSPSVRLAHSSSQQMTRTMLSTLPSRRCAACRSLMAKCLISPIRQCCPPLLQPTPLLAWPRRASSTGTNLWHRAISRQKSLPPLLHSIGIFCCQDCFLSSSLSRHQWAQGAQGTAAWIRSGSLFFFLLFLSHKPRYHNLLKGHITMMHRSAVAPLGMKASCALCHAIGAHAAACTTAK